jgi:hypothetical protein
MSSRRKTVCHRKITDLLFGQWLLEIRQIVFSAVCPAQITLCTNASRQDFPVLPAHDANLTPKRKAVSAHGIAPFKDSTLPNQDSVPEFHDLETFFSFYLRHLFRKASVADQ